MSDYALENFHAALSDHHAAQANPSPLLNRVHQVSAPVGSGKTTAALAWTIAFTKHALENPQALRGCVLVVEQIMRAEEFADTLRKSLPAGTVAVFTHDHDPKCKKPKHLDVPMEHRCSREALADHLVIIVTHKFYFGPRGHLAREFRSGDISTPRAVTIIDEQPEEVAIFDVGILDATCALTEVQRNVAHAETIGPRVQALVDHMNARAYGASIEKPMDHERWAEDEDALRWFTTPEAINFVKEAGGGEESAIRAVFEFARLYATGYGFIARTAHGTQGTRFMAHERHASPAPGTVLLDATADIDGVSQIAPWRHAPLEPPAVSYENLTLVHEPMHVRARMTEYLKKAANRHEHTDFALELIKKHVSSGERCLLVCWKKMIENRNLPHWPERDARWEDKAAYTEDFGWEFEGRHIAVIHWGSNIGSNKYQKADVVILLDEFHMPKRKYIALAQGLKNHKATEGALAGMKTLNKNVPVVNTLREGDILRFTKQLALRANGRNYDEHGICGVQKIVFTGDVGRLARNVERLFPGAPPVLYMKAPATRAQRKADRFWEVLRTTTRNELTTKNVAALMGVDDWRTFGKNLMRDPNWAAELKREDWEYLPRCKGRRLGVFRKLGAFAAVAEQDQHTGFLGVTGGHVEAVVL